MILNDDFKYSRISAWSERTSVLESPVERLLFISGDALKGLYTDRLPWAHTGACRTVRTFFTKASTSCQVFVQSSHHISSDSGAASYAKIQNISQTNVAQFFSLFRCCAAECAPVLPLPVRRAVPDPSASSPIPPPRRTVG